MKNEQLIELAQVIKRQFVGQKDLSHDQLYKLADAIGYVSDRTQLWDALQIAHNLYIIERHQSAGTFSLAVGLDRAAIFYKQIVDDLNKLPTHNARTDQMLAFQQFSTPPHFAYIAAWAAGIMPDDTVMEPSAGLLGLATFASLAHPKALWVNEYEPYRFTLVKDLINALPVGEHDKFKMLQRSDACQIFAYYPKLKPDVILMNPPFSSEGMKGVSSRYVASNHLEKALMQLADGGRVVAILPGGRDGDAGMHFAADSYKAFWKKISLGYTIRCNIGVPENFYKKFGTSFNTRLVIIDKTGPTVNEPVYIGQVERVGELFTLLDPLRKRAKREVKAIVPLPGRIEEYPAEMPAKPVLPPPPPIRKPVLPPPPPIRKAVMAQLKIEEDEEIELFMNYKPFLYHPLAKPHKVALVESDAMRAVKPPIPRVKFSFPREIITSGRLSDVQLEGLFYAMNSNAQRIPGTRTRKTFLVGDGTGVGKGAQLAAVAMACMMKGMRKILWVSKTGELINDAIRDWKWIGGDEKFIIPHEKLKGDITLESGIIFSTYMMASRKQHIKETRDENGVLTVKTKGTDRFKQLVDWKPDIILYDESHELKNSLSESGKRGAKKVAKKAVQGIELINAMPEAVIAMASATAATEVSNLAYAVERMGLAGPHSNAFADTEAFVSKVNATGMLGMELIAKDMKALGLYRATSLSYSGTEFEVLEHKLTEAQRKIYDDACDGWQLALVYIEEALELTGAGQNRQAKGQVLAQFYGTMQRFFNQLLTSLQMPTVLKDMEMELAQDNSCVFQLVNTEEAATGRAVKNAIISGDGYDNLDISPKDALIDLIRKHYPIVMYEEVWTGNTTSSEPVKKAVLDEDGNQKMEVKLNPVTKKPELVPMEEFLLDPMAIQMRDELLLKIADIQVPKGALDMILEHFGHENVAEVTGRSERYVNVDHKLVRETRGKRKCSAETREFMAGKRRIIIFSEAGGTGRSFHSDLNSLNQQRRVHYGGQMGWIADKAIQGLGRSHRNNQRVPPKYKLATTDLPGQKRFITSIARRIEQLGSLTKGNRKAASGGIFKPEDNLEGPYASSAIQAFFRGLRYGEFAEQGLSYTEVCRQMGFAKSKLEGGGGDAPKMPPVTQFLNRLLALHCDMQKNVFEVWYNIMVMLIEQARERGELETGMEYLKADKIEKVSQQLIHKDAETGAKTYLVELKTQVKRKFVTAEHAREGVYLSSSGEQKLGGGHFQGFYKNKKSGNIFVHTHVSTTIEGDGSKKEIYRRVGPTSAMLYSREELDISMRNGTGDESIPTSLGMELWNKQIEATPSIKEQTLHVITGAIIPVWANIAVRSEQRNFFDEEEHDSDYRVIAVQLPGERFIGRVLPHDLMMKTMQNLGMVKGGIYLSYEQIRQKLDDGYRVLVGTGQAVVKRTVSRLERFVLTHITPTEAKELAIMGIVKREVINYSQATTYINPDNEQGEEEMLKQFIVQRGAIAIEDKQGDQTPLLKEPKQEKHEELTEGPQLDQYDISHLITLVDFPTDIPGIIGLPKEPEREEDDDAKEASTMPLFTERPEVMIVTPSDAIRLTPPPRVTRKLPAVAVQTSLF